MSELPEREMRLIEYTEVNILAAQQSAVGLELAFAANEALTKRDEVNAAREAVIYDDDALSRRGWYTTTYLAQEPNRALAGGYEQSHRQLAESAGALIGRLTLGGEFISVGHGNEPVLNADGSYIVGSAER